METERVIVPFDEAVAMLPEGESIHTFRQSVNGILLGVSIGRERLLDLMRSRRVELTGDLATRMGHGLALTDDQGFLFIATRREAAPCQTT